MSKTRAPSRKPSGTPGRRVRIWIILCVSVGTIFALLAILTSGRAPGPDKMAFLTYSPPADLLPDPVPVMTHEDIADVLNEMARQASIVPGSLKHVVVTRVALNVPTRWMSVEFREHDIPVEWLVAGQIISDDQLGSLESVQFIPRFITNSADRDGSGISDLSARDGWAILRPDLERLAKEAVKAVASRRGWTMPASSGDHPLPPSETPRGDNGKTPGTTPGNP